MVEGEVNEMIAIIKIFSTILFFIFFLIRPAYAITHLDIIQRIDSDIEVSNNLLSEMESVQNDPDAILRVLLRDIPTIIQHWSESTVFYESKIATENDEELRTILININNQIKILSSDLSSVEESINAGDADTYSSSLDQYDRDIGLLNTYVDSLNNYFGVDDDYSWLAWPFWIALIISIVLFVMSRGNPILPAEQLRDQFEFALFKSSLWPFAGSAISYFWYLLTPPGGTFYILWWIVGAGYFQFARGLYGYLRYSRPAINLAKQEEQTKLEKLIMSDEFQHQNLKEKVEEIEKLSPVIKIGKSTCGNCGTENSNRAKFCKSCGNKL